MTVMMATSAAQQAVSMKSDTFTCLTGTPEEISRVAAQYRVYYEKSGSGPDYLMDHSGIIYLMDREGRFLTHFSQGTTPDRIADAIRQAQAQHPPQSS